MTELIELKTIINETENALFENAEYDPRLSLADNVRGVCLDLERAQKSTTSALAEHDELIILRAETEVLRGRDENQADELETVRERCAALETQRDLALAKAKSYAHSRDTWLHNFHSNCERLIAAKAKNTRLVDVLSYFVCHWPASAEKDELLDDMFTQAMDLTGVLPFTDATESEHAPDTAVDFNAAMVGEWGHDD